MVKHTKLIVLVLLIFTVSACSNDADNNENETEQTSNDVISISDDNVDNLVLDLFGLVPDTPQAREEVISYVDFQAAFASRPSVPQLDDWAELEELADTEPERLWLAALQGIQSGSRFTQYISSFGEMRGNVGFDFFDVQRELYYGRVPADVMVFAGSFDPESITAAFSERDYTVEQEGDMLILCGSNGCESGMEQNLSERNVANPFGGYLGREQPVLMLLDVVLSSADYVSVESHIAVIQGNQNALAADPIFESAARAVNAEGMLIQAAFIDPELLDFLGDPLTVILGPQVTEEQRAALAEQYGLDRSISERMDELIPSYELVFFADVVQEGEQVAIIGLVFDEEDDAHVAGERVVNQINTYTSMARGQPMSEILDSVEARVDNPYVIAVEPTGQYVTIVGLRAPLPSDEPDPETGRYDVSGRVYRVLINMLYDRDLFWLATVESLLASENE